VTKSTDNCCLDHYKLRWIEHTLTHKLLLCDTTEERIMGIENGYKHQQDLSGLKEGSWGQE